MTIHYKDKKYPGTKAECENHNRYSKSHTTNTISSRL